VPRSIDGAVGDYGFFVGVADRLRAGDALYEQVWDNKDPLYFYTLAIAQSAGPWGLWLLEIIWIAIASLAVYGITRKLASLSSDTSVLCAASATPLILLGMPYFMGSTHLPGIAISLVIVAAAFRGRWILTGFLVAVLAILKLVLLPIPLAAVAVVLLFRRSRSGLVRFVLSLGATALAFGALLAARGELGGFLTTQVDNVRHAQAPIVNAEQSTLFYKVAQHVVILINPNIFLILVTTAVILLAAGWQIFRVSRSESDSVRLLWWMAIAIFLAAVLVIAVTGKWFHHAQALEISSVLVFVLLVTRLSDFRNWRAWLSVPLALVVLFLLMGGPPLSSFTEKIRTAPATWSEAQRDDPLSVLLRDRSPSTIAYVGFGNLVPRSGGLGDWDLVCRHIGQRPFHPQWMFDETLACLPTAEMVVVTNDYGPDPAFPVYTSFVESVEEILSRDYNCEMVDGFRLCTRR